MELYVVNLFLIIHSRPVIIIVRFFFSDINIREVKSILRRNFFLLRHNYHQLRKKKKCPCGIMCIKSS